MRRRERQATGRGGAATAELEALLRAGDHRRAARCAERLLADVDTPPRDRERARAALARTARDPAAALVAAACLVGFFVVAVLGLIVRS